MVEYYSTHPTVAPTSISSNTNPSITVSEFNKHCKLLFSNEVMEGWVPELRRYLKMIQCDIKKDADIAEWWQVSFIFSKLLLY